MIKKIIKTVFVGILASLIGFSVWMAKPWLDYDPWRWYLAAKEGWRADHFSHWERVQPYRTIPASSRPREFERKTGDLSQVMYEFDGQQYPVTHYIEKANIAGLLVMYGGKVRFEYYGKGIEQNSSYHIWSATKSFTSTLVGMALFEGKISSLDDPVEKYAPQFKGSAYGETSIRHLLMMSSGIDFFHFKGKPDRTDMYWDIIQKGEDFDKWAAELGRRVSEGTDFNYIATDTHVASAVLRTVYGKPLAEIAHDKLWEPGGFAGDAMWAQDSSGHALGHCCLSVRLQDFAHLGQLYLEDLVLQGQPTVSEEWFNMVEKPHADFQEPYIDVDTGKLEEGYTFQFWLPENYDHEFMAAGAFGQYLWIDRKLKYVVAQFSIGQPIGRKGESGAGPREKEAVMRALGRAVIAATK
ncbi:MAG: serine hydrolase [Deltaproteobacteria bacterium]|nr:serine hydrolase [Deltaproteobacteria bacterium]